MCRGAGPGNHVDSKPCVQNLCMLLAFGTVGTGFALLRHAFMYGIRFVENRQVFTLVTLLTSSLFT